jgi:TolA-binding protein
LGITRARQQRWASALESFGAVDAASTWHPRALYESAWCAKALNQTDAAAKFYEQLLSTYPQHELAPAAVFELAELEYQRKQFAPAAARLEKALETLPAGDLRERALFRLGWCWFDQENLLKAAPVYEQLIKESPASALVLPASFQAGEARLKLKEYPAAHELFSRAVALEREKKALTEPSLLRLGEVQGLTGLWADSEKTYTEFISTFPSSEFLRRARFGLGWARENNKDYAKAIEAYAQVVAEGVKDETGARCQFQIGECRLALEQYDEAIKAFVDVEVNYAYPHYSSKALLEMGVCLERKGDNAAALDQYREIVAKYPDTEAASVARQALKQQKP